MQTLSHKAGWPRNGIVLPSASLPLFIWADAQAAFASLPTTHAERALMQRHHMPLHMARVIAENALIGERA